MDEEDRQLCQALSGAGIQVCSIYDLVNTSADYDAALPVLVEWLPKTRDDRIKEGIVRALTLKTAGENVALALVSEFENYEADTPSKEATKWAIGNAICEVAVPSVLRKLIELASDKRHGSARQMLAIAIGKTGNSAPNEALEILVGLLEDPDVQGHAVTGLGFLGDERSRLVLEQFRGHEKAWIRNEAKRALSRLDRSKKGH